MKTSWMVATCALMIVGTAAPAQLRTEGIRSLSRSGTIAGAEPDGVDLEQTVSLVSTAPGTIVALQPRDGVVRVYSGRGGGARTIGRNGRGPGEFIRPSSVGMVGDSVWIHDSALNRLSMYSKTWQLLTTIDVAAFASGGRSGSLQRSRHGTIVGVLRGGSMLMYRDLNGSDMPTPTSGSTEKRVELFILDRAARAERTLDSLRFLAIGSIEIAPRQVIRLTDRLAELDRVAVAPDGGAYAIINVDTTSPSAAFVRIRMFEATGRQRYDRRFPCEKRPLSKEEIAGEVAGFADGIMSMPGAGSSAVDAYRRFVESHTAAPCVRNALTAPDGTVWLQIGKLPTERWVRIDRDGTSAVETRFPDRAKRRVVRVDSSGLWAIESSDDDVTTIAWYSLDPR